MKYKYLAIITVLVIAMFIMLSFSEDLYRNDVRSVNEIPASDNYTKIGNITYIA